MRDLEGLLAEHRLDGIAEQPFQTDGWSGAQLTRLVRADGSSFVLKRDSLARDWIARATNDAPQLREALLVAAAPRLPEPVTLPHLGVARDGDAVVLLMPDLAGTLIPWEQPVDVATLDRVLDALAALHRESWHEQLPGDFPWTDRARRITLLTRRAAERYTEQGLAFGARFSQGWDAFARLAPRRAVELLDRLTADPTSLVRAIDRLPATGLHGDLKLGNVGLAADGSIPIIDWQMTLVAPIAVELGWFLVANVAGLPFAPDEVLERYRRAAGLPNDELWSAQSDLAVIVGLYLRGWRKGLDAEDNIAHPGGVDAAADLAWWASNAVAAAQRRL